MTLHKITLVVLIWFGISQGAAQNFAVLDNHLETERSALAENAPRLAEQQVTLTLKPNLCILDHQYQHCEDTVLVEWQSSQAISPCLQILEQTYEFCWEQSLSGFNHIPLTTQQSLSFLLQQDAEILATAMLKVVTNYSSRKERLRRRNPWSLF